MPDDIQRSAHGTAIGGSREEEKLDELGARATDDPEDVLLSEVTGEGRLDKATKKAAERRDK